MEMNDEQRGTMFKEMAKARVEAEENAKEVEKAKEQYAEWVKEFGHEITTEIIKEKETNVLNSPLPEFELCVKIGELLK